MEITVSQSRPCTILVVDDDPAMRSLLVDELSESGCRVIESADGDDAKLQLKTYQPDLIVTDLKMPGGGFEYLKDLRNCAKNCPVILITAFGNSQTKKKAQACGVAAYFDKPVRVKDLRVALQQVCSVVKSASCKNMSNDGQG